MRKHFFSACSITLCALALVSTANACTIRGAINDPTQLRVNIWEFRGCANTDGANFPKDSFPIRLQAFLDTSGGKKVVSHTATHFVQDGHGGMYADSYVVITEGATTFNTAEALEE